jgi:hypothetical protein
MRPIIFFIEDKNCGAPFLLGTMLKHSFDQFEFPVEIKYSENINTVKDSLVFVYKHSPSIKILDMLKSNGNKIVMDVVDEFIRPGTNVLDLYDYSYFDGLLIRVNKILDEYKFPEHLIIGYIAHHWDIRLQDVTPNPNFNPTPLGVINDARDMPFASELINNNIIKLPPNFNPLQFGSLIDEFNQYSIHYSVRQTNSIAYKFKPFTKLITASAFEAPLITNYDWAIRDLVPEDYPYLIEGNSYQEIVELINSIHPDTKEWKYAVDVMKYVKAKTALVNLIPEYIDFYNKFI